LSCLRFAPTLMEFVAPRSLVCGQAGNLLSRSPPPWLDRFRPALRLSCSPFLDLFGPRFILPRAFLLLQRSRSIARSSRRSQLRSFDLHPGGRRAPSLGFRPSSRSSIGSSSGVGSRASRRCSSPGYPGWNLCPSRAVRPRRFARPRRFVPLPILRACFISLPRSGFLLQGFIPRARVHSGFRRTFPLLSLGNRACGVTRASSTTVDFRGLLPASSAVTCVLGENTPAPRPSWLFAFLGSFRPVTWHSPSGLPPSAIFFAMSPSRRILDVLRSRDFGCLSPGFQPVQSS
jgi:hypothetical protein